MSCTFEELIKYEIMIYKFSKKFVFDLDKFNELLDFLLGNSYVNFNNIIYKQNQGIPMGESYSPMLANLYLHYFEHLFRHTLVTDSKFNYVYRYIDDLLWISLDNYTFDLGTIYPVELEINKVNVIEDTAEYLHLHIFKFYNKIVSKVFDKRRLYSFEILGLPSPHSNI